MPKNKHPAVLVSLTYGILLAGLVGYNVADTFLIEHADTTVSDTSEDFSFDDTDSTSTTTSTDTSDSTSTNDTDTSSSTTTDTTEETSTYSETTVTMTKGTKTIDGHSVTYYLTEVKLKKLSDLRTKLATNSSGSVGSNITQSFTSLISDATDDAGTTPLVAISGDYCYWKSRKGYVVRNGATYRTTQRSDTENEDFAIFKDGTVATYLETDYSASDLADMNNGCYQNWCFGPALISNGSIAVTTTEEITGQSSGANQRSAIGYAGTNHFFFLTTEIYGDRSSGSGFSLYQLASVLQDAGCTYAYNLDGGGTASLYYDSSVVVTPNRKLGDIIYVINS